MEEPDRELEFRLVQTPTENDLDRINLKYLISDEWISQKSVLILSLTVRGKSPRLAWAEAHFKFSFQHYLTHK